MIQRHSIIMWKKAEPSNKSFCEIAKELFDLLILFQDYSSELRPNYLTTNKDNSDLFKWTYDNFVTVLKKGINKEGDNRFEQLGYSMSFFSSKCENESAAFQITAGCKVNNMNNTFILHLPKTYPIFEEIYSDVIIQLFRSLTAVYKPIWGCVSNRLISREYGKYMSNGIPTTVHWLNYWSEEVINNMGEEVIKKVQQDYKEVTFNNNIMLSQRRPFDIENEKDMLLHKELERSILG